MATHFDLQLWLRHGAILGVARTKGEKSFLLGIGGPTCHSDPDPDLACFYAPDFFLRYPKPWLRFSGTRWVSLPELETGLDHFLTKFPQAPEPIHWHPASSAQFEAPFFDLQKCFRAKKLIKAVPVVFDRARCELEPARLARWLRNALSYASHFPVHVYGAWGMGDETGILGVTPESLFGLESIGLLRTAAIAGTRRDSDHAVLGNLVNDPKERREHQLVIDGIAQALQPLGKVVIQATEVLQLPGLSHLKTPIELRADRPRAFTEYVGRLHPTPALGAVPKPEGWNWLQRQDEISPVKRLRFGAPFGAIWKAENEAETALCVVAIRNVQWRRDKIFAELLLGAGCGVIAESRFDHEWLELQGKALAVRRLLGL